MTSVPTYPNNERQNSNGVSRDATEIQTTETHVVHHSYGFTSKHLRSLQNQEGSNIIQSNVGHPPRKISDSQVGRVRSITIKEREELKTTIGFNTNVGHYNQPTLKDTTI